MTNQLAELKEQIQEILADIQHSSEDYGFILVLTRQIWYNQDKSFCK